MWVFFARAGFFSVVQPVDSTGHLVVRARVRDDLIRLRRLYVPGLGRIAATPTRDYGFRALVTRADLAAGLATAVAEIDFSNFKNEVAQRLGGARAKTYERVWAALMELQHAVLRPGGC